MHMIAPRVPHLSAITLRLDALRACMCMCACMENLPRDPF
jgi:hypothetical protein